MKSIRLFLMSVLIFSSYALQESNGQSQELPCKGPEFQSTETTLFGYGEGVSSNLSFARSKAISEAKMNLSEQIKQVISIEKSSGTKMVKSTTRTFIPSLSTVCSKAAQDGGRFTSWVVVKLSWLDYYTELNKLEDEELTKYGYSREDVVQNIAKYTKLEEELEKTKKKKKRKWGIF